MDDHLTLAWTRDTTWRQGQVLSVDALDAIGLRHGTEPDATCVVVISHDCDLANDNLASEPSVEIILGRVVPKANGNFAWGKAPRTLHLEMLHNGQPVVVELVATQKQQISKSQLAAFSRDPAFHLDSRMLSVLRNWLAVRYRRAAFPDPFVERMESTKLDTKLARLLEPYGNVISSIFFDVDRGGERDHSDGSPYELSIVLAYVPGDDPDAAYEKASPVESAVEKLFSDRLFDKTSETWQEIALRKCALISEDDLSVSQAKLFMQWRLEHMSLRSEDDHPHPLEFNE